MAETKEGRSAGRESRRQRLLFSLAPRRESRCRRTVSESVRTGFQALFFTKVKINCLDREKSRKAGKVAQKRSFLIGPRAIGARIAGKAGFFKGPESGLGDGVLAAFFGGDFERRF